MGRFLGRWDAEDGQKLCGKILYFENPDGSFTAVIRTPKRFYILPSDAAEAFLAGRPPEGSDVEIEKTPTGYQLRSSQQPHKTNA